MKTLSDCISALSRTKHLLTDPEAGPCPEECAGTIEEALAFLGTLENAESKHFRPSPCASCGRRILWKESCYQSTQNPLEYRCSDCGKL